MLGRDSKLCLPKTEDYESLLLSNFCWVRFIKNADETVAPSWRFAFATVSLQLGGV